jgi:hypothetical protein
VHLLLELLDAGQAVPDQVDRLKLPRPQHLAGLGDRG